MTDADFDNKQLRKIIRHDIMALKKETEKGTGMSKMKVPIPEAEENLIVDYIYMTDLIKNIENDHQAALKLKFKIPEEYRHLIESKIKELRRQLVDLKAKMKELRIKVADPVRVNEEFIEYSYYPCGYEGKMRFWDAAMVYEGF